MVLFHKIKKYNVIMGNLTAAMMAVVLSFAYYHYYNTISFEEIENYKATLPLFFACVFSFLLLLIREMIKI
jgi:hypothetical protein